VRNQLFYVALLAGCVTTVEPDHAWERFRDSAAREVDGRTIYVVEWDLPVTLDELRDYYDQHVADDGAGTTQQASTVASTPQGDDLWSATDRQHLTYCVSDAFGASKARAVAEMASATRSWEAEAHINFEYAPQHDASCDQFNLGVKFAVRPWTQGGACAFFPSGSASCTPRTLLMNFTEFDTNPARKLQEPLLTTVGVFRHELGHILGLRHEQVQAPNSGGCPPEGMPFRPVTTYDRASVMHYPQCGGFLNSDQAISTLDAVGIRLLYGASLSPYDQHFVVGNVDFNPRLDIVQAIRGGASLPTCRFTGLGFSCNAPSATSYDWDARQQVLAGDFNGDGMTDVAQTFFRWGSIPTCLSGNNGNAWNCNNPVAPIVAHPGDDDETRFLVGKFNGDAKDDVVEINRKASTILTCLSTATSTAASWNCTNAGSYLPWTGTSEQEFLVGEVDNPAASPTEDLISTWRGVSSLPVCHSQPGGWYCQDVPATVYNSQSIEQRFLKADLNNDQRIDVLQVFRGWRSIPTCTAATNVNGDFSGWTCRNPAADIYDSGSHEQQFLAGDFNGDGKTDVVQTYRGWSSLPVCVQTGTTVNGTFEPSWSCANPAALIRDSGSRQQRFVVADVDRDGRSDVIQIFPGWSEYPVCFSRGFADVTWSCGRYPAAIIKPGIDDRFLSSRQMVDFATHSYKGISVIGVKDGKTVFSHSAGNATSANLATADTAWHLASVSKLFIGTAALIAQERGQLSVNQSAGLANPLPGMNLVQPTIAQFANHTAGVQRDPCTSETLGDPDMNLAFAMSGCLSKPANQQWLPVQPGALYQYSNFGAAWVARRVELQTGTDFAAFVRSTILNPLGMTRSGHSITSLNGQTHAQGWLNLSTPSPFNGVNPYPAGNLRASANDLAKFMIMWTNGGVGANGTRVLSQASVDYALTQQNSTISGFGFFWQRRATESGRWLWGHDGLLQASATCTVLTIDPATREGVAIMVNGKCGDTPALFTAIEDRVYRTMQTL